MHTDAVAVAAVEFRAKSDELQHSLEPGDQPICQNVPRRRHDHNTGEEQQIEEKFEQKPGRRIKRLPCHSHDTETVYSSGCVLSKALC